MNAKSNPSGANPPYTIDFPASLVREAVGLDIDEKVMLFVIASHATWEARTSREHFEAQLGFRGNRLYAVRKKLLEKKLITVTERAIGTTTLYRINRRQLLKWVEHPDEARLWQRNARAIRLDDRPGPQKPRRLGADGVKRLLEDARHRRGRARERS